MWSRFKKALYLFFFWEPDYGPLADLYRPQPPVDHPLLTITKITQ